MRKQIIENSKPETDAISERIESSNNQQIEANLKSKTKQAYFPQLNFHVWFSIERPSIDLYSPLGHRRRRHPLGMALIGTGIRPQRAHGTLNPKAG